MNEFKAERLDRRDFIKKLPGEIFRGLRSVWREPARARASRDAAEEGQKEPVEQGPFAARLDVARCLAWEGTPCQLCYLACHLRDQAIEMRDGKPVIFAAHCDGCSMCVTACGTVNDLVAIRMIPEDNTDSRKTWGSEAFT